MYLQNRALDTAAALGGPSARGHTQGHKASERYWDSKAVIHK
jgi:hypothetical protein